MDPPSLIARREFDLRRWKRRDGNRTGTRLFSLTLNPCSMSFDEALNGDSSGARRHDDFHATGVKDTHGKTACAMTLTHYPSLGGILIGPQRQLGRNHA
jgi:hypothetical protein